MVHNHTTPIATHTAMKLDPIAEYPAPSDDTGWDDYIAYVIARTRSEMPTPPTGPDDNYRYASDHGIYLRSWSTAFASIRQSMDEAAEHCISQAVSDKLEESRAELVAMEAEINTHLCVIDSYLDNYVHPPERV